MKKKQYIILSILLITGIIVAGKLLIKPSDEEKTSENTIAKTITYDNGDYLYVPTEETIVLDQEEKLLFFEDIVEVYLHSEVTEAQADEMIHLVDGEIIGELKGAINVLQVQVNGKSFTELHEHIDSLYASEFVKYVSLSFPSLISDLNEQSYSYDKSWGDGEIVNEEQPNGKNWWAEAIKAYSAWDFMDSNTMEFEDVKVAILESGKLTANDVENIKNTPNFNAIDDLFHAESVTKIIAGNEKSNKNRGVAAGVVDVEYYSLGDLNTHIEIIAEIKKSVENGAKVINNSWGIRPMTEKQFEYQKNRAGSYDDHIKAMVNHGNETAESLIVAIDELLQKDDCDFLFIQAAGNGLHRFNEDKSIEGEVEEARSLDTILGARASGYFTNVNQETYNRVAKHVGLENELVDILDRIIIVGGVEKLPDGSYKSPDWAGYGEAVNIVAPAEDIYIDGNKIYGTSFATPMVTGAVALIWYYDKDLSSGKVKERLLESAQEYAIGAKGDPRKYPLLNTTAYIEEYEDLDFTGYDTLIDTYRIAILEEWDMERRYMEGIALEFDNDLEGYGYEIRDINNDGIPEMIVGSSDFIDSIYTLDDLEPVLLFARGIRHDIHLYDDGVIEMNGVFSIPQGEHGRAFYKLNKNGSVELKDGYIYSESEEIYKSIKSSDGPTTTNEENELKQYIQEIDDIYKQPVQPRFKAFIEKRNSK